MRPVYHRRGLITHCSLVLLGRPKNKESVVVASDITDSPHGGPESPFEARIHPVNSYRAMTSRRTTDTLGTRHTQFECCTKQLVALNSPIFPVGNLTQDPALILDSPRHTGGTYIRAVTEVNGFRTFPVINRSFPETDQTAIGYTKTLPVTKIITLFKG